MKSLGKTMQKFEHDDARFNNFLAAAALIYFALYFVYQIVFIELVNELNHWLTLVLIPAMITLFGLKRTAGRTSIRAFLRVFGLHFDNFKRVLPVALTAGIIMGCFQLLLSRKTDAILESIREGDYFYKLPIAFFMMLLTAGFTEEFFFRGFVQSSLERMTRSRMWSVVISSILFGIYHFPFAYYKESWPSHGNFVSAISEGVVFSAIIGLILGTLYARWRSLFVPIFVHALFNAIWFATMLKI